MNTMLLNIVIATILMMATTVVHTVGMMVALSMMRKHEIPTIHRLLRSDVYHVGCIVLLLFYISLVEVLLWAATYLALNAIEGFERALYFSMVTFTTLGYGEIILDDQYRLLASFEAANGIILFGWSTAIVIYAVQHIHTGKKNVK